VSFADKKKRVWSEKKDSLKIGKRMKGKVVHKTDFGFIVELDSGISGFLSFTKIPMRIVLKMFDTIEVVIAKINYEKQQISLKL